MRGAHLAGATKERRAEKRKNGPVIQPVFFESFK
jgi:hypothetical protein